MESQGSGPISSPWIVQGLDQEQRASLLSGRFVKEQETKTKQVGANVFIALEKDEMLPVFDTILLKIHTDMQ